MKYSEVRDTIRSGDIVALSNQDWSSWGGLQSQVVKSVTQSPYSHVALVWRVANRVFLIESVQPVVRIYPLSNLKDGFYLVPTNLDISEKELEFALSHVGDSHYSKLEAIAAQFDLIQIGASEAWECAEFVICCRQLSGLNIQSKATPAAVMQWLLEHGYDLKYISEKT